MAGHGLGGQLDSEVCFTKILTPSDIKYGFEVPRTAVHLPEVDEVMYVVDQNQDVWMFKAPARITGKRRFSHEWLPFARAASARAGDKLTLYRLMVNEPWYVARLQSPVDIRLFGVIMRGYPD